MKKTENISEALKRFIEASGQSQRQIALSAGVSPVVVNRFLRQGRGLSVEGIDGLCRVLGLQLVQTGKTPKTTARSRKEK